MRIGAALLGGKNVFRKFARFLYRDGIGGNLHAD